ncbi:dUTP diphosphatase [Candidatus Uhrbacteria bacterium]|nr:dUTP diphosphatase [Candidatus Uhrbacteria bacterium]
MAETPLKVKIKRIDKDLPLPIYQTAGSVAVDLYARTDYTVKPKEIVLIPGNIIVQPPAGYFFVIVARSSLPRKKGLVVPQAVGIVDADFCGEKDEILLQMMNITDAPVEVKRGERIAQGFFMKSDRIEWQEVDQMASDSRGGFGSTG